MDLCPPKETQHGTTHGPAINSAQSAAAQVKHIKQQAAKVKASKSKAFFKAFPESERCRQLHGV